MEFLLKEQESKWLEKTLWTLPPVPGALRLTLSSLRPGRHTCMAPVQTATSPGSVSTESHLLPNPLSARLTGPGPQVPSPGRMVVRRRHSRGEP